MFEMHRFSIAGLLLLIVRIGFGLHHVDAGISKHLQTVFERHLNLRRSLESVHYSLLGLKLLDVDVVDTTVCAYLRDSIDYDNAITLYYALTAASKLKACNIPLKTAKWKELQKNVEAKGPSVGELLVGVRLLPSDAVSASRSAINKYLEAALSKDQSILSTAESLHIATYLGKADSEKHFSRLADYMKQAESISSDQLCFEGSIYSTVMMLTGMYSLAEKLNKAPPISHSELFKFANFILDRHMTHSARTAYFLLDGAKVLSKNKFHMPVSVTLASTRLHTAQSQLLRVRVTNLLGEPLPSSVTGPTASIHSGGPVLTAASLSARSQSGVNLLAASPIKLVEDTAHRGFHDLDLAKLKLSPGFYTLQVVSAASNPKSLLAIPNTSFSIKVVSDITIESGSLLKIINTEAKSVVRSIKLSYPHSVTAQDSIRLSGDHNAMRVVFSVSGARTNVTGVDTAAAADRVLCHQVFARLTPVSPTDGASVTYVVEADARHVYMFDMNVLDVAPDFQHVSGDYRLQFIVGDWLAATPIVWDVAQVSIVFPAFTAQRNSHVSPPSWLRVYQPKPEIHHVFGTPEARPPLIVSTVFTGAVFVPLLVMILLWIGMRVNVAKFPISVASIGFFLGLIGIFGLYILFWLQLNMFQTLKWLAILSPFTFLCGHSTLKKVASSKSAAGVKA